MENKEEFKLEELESRLEMGCIEWRPNHWYCD